MWHCLDGPAQFVNPNFGVALAMVSPRQDIRPTQLHNVLNLLCLELQAINKRLLPNVAMYMLGFCIS